MDRNAFDSEIDRFLTAARNLIPNEELPDLPPRTESPDVPQWYPFEHDLWRIGEAIRQLILASNKQLNKTQTEMVLQICIDPNAKRGRQSFILLLGKSRYRSYADRLVPLLNDRDVDGQVIDTLYKMRASGYAASIVPFLNHDRTWVRKEAQRYLQKYP